MNQNSEPSSFCGYFTGSSCPDFVHVLLLSMAVGKIPWHFPIELY